MQGAGLGGLRDACADYALSHFSCGLLPSVGVLGLVVSISVAILVVVVVAAISVVVAVLSLSASSILWAASV